MENCRVYIVDDKAFNIQILTEKLSVKQGVELIGTACDGADFLKKMADLLVLPHVVFMDIDMPIKNGIDTVLEAKVAYPDVHFVMLTVFDDEERIFNAIQVGASGYLLKDDSVVSIHRAIEDVMEFGAAPLAPAIARKAYSFIQKENQKENEAKNTSPLSNREKDILLCLTSGKGYRQIADQLFISPHTVRKHMTNIYEKLQVNSKVEAVRLAMEKKWV